MARLKVCPIMSGGTVERGAALHIGIRTTNIGSGGENQRSF